MSTLSTTSINWLADQWEGAYKTAVLSGIVGDLAHKARGGYHISREDQGKSNYSVIRPDDKPGNGPSDRASAVDMTMSTADIIKCHTRLRECWKNRAKDSRMKYINAWNGWDGDGDAGRYDVVEGDIETASADHKWHIHLEIRRKYVNDMNAMRAILSMLKGESLSAWTGEGDDDMPDQKTFQEWVDRTPLNDKGATLGGSVEAIVADGGAWIRARFIDALKSPEGQAAIRAALAEPTTPTATAAKK